MTPKLQALEEEVAKRETKLRALSDEVEQLEANKAKLEEQAAEAVVAGDKKKYTSIRRQIADIAIEIDFNKDVLDSGKDPQLAEKINNAWAEYINTMQAQFEEADREYNRLLNEFHNAFLKRLDLRADAYRVRQRLGDLLGIDHPHVFDVDFALPMFNVPALSPGEHRQDSNYFNAKVNVDYNGTKRDFYSLLVAQHRV